MKKTIAFLVVIAVLLLAACAPAATPTAAPATEAPATEAPATEVPATEVPATEAPAAAAVELNFWSWVPSIEEQVDEWNQTHPDIQVIHRNAGAGNAEYTVLNTALQANTDIPDVVQIEYQHLPAYIVQDVLLDLTQYGANDVKDQFVPWTWSQVSQGDGVYAYPQDAGPMVMFCNDAVLEEYGISVPTTWDEFAQAAAELNQAAPDVYLSNFTADQGWFFGVLWQSGAQPFVVDGENITIDFTSPEVMRVAKYWGDLMNAGVLSPIETYTSDWNTALGNGSIACWPSGAWGTYISGNAPDYAGQMQVYLMPQWTAGGEVNGNYGGSTIAVMKASAHPKEAAEFALWLNTDPKITLDLTNPDKAGLFPVTLATLSNPEWSDITYDYWSGQAIHQVMAEAAQQVDPNFGWSPFTSFVYSTYADNLTEVRAGSMTFEEAMQDMQDKCVAFAEDQGFTVSTP
jgi:multiple sugar transport system substrate-binding protein